MTLTITTQAKAEVVMLRRASGFMDAAGMDIITSDGTNDDLQDPFEAALRWLSIDSVLALADEEEEAEFLAIMELRLLQNILSNYAKVDIRAGERFSAWGQLANRIRQRYQDALEAARDRFGYSLAALEAGVIQTDINEDGS